MQHHMQIGDMKGCRKCKYSGLKTYSKHTLSYVLMLPRLHTLQQPMYNCMNKLSNCAMKTTCVKLRWPLRFRAVVLSMVHRHIFCCCYQLFNHFHFIGGVNRKLQWFIWIGYNGSFTEFYLGFNSFKCMRLHPDDSWVIGSCIAWLNLFSWFLLSLFWLLLGWLWIQFVALLWHRLLHIVYFLIHIMGKNRPKNSDNSQLQGLQCCHTNRWGQHSDRWCCHTDRQSGWYWSHYRLSDRWR